MSELSVRFAWPDPFRGTGGWGTPSITNVTVPVGMAVLGLLAVTVAVSVTGWWGSEFCVEVVTVTVAPVGVTVWLGDEFEMPV